MSALLSSRAHVAAELEPCWSVLLGGLALLLRGRFGAITEAVRDNEERARFIGIRTLLPRAALFALSAGITSVAGVLTALNTGFVSPESLHWSVSGVALMMVVVGGYKALWGPALGATVYFLAKDVLGDYAQALDGDLRHRADHRHRLFADRPGRGAGPPVQGQTPAPRSRRAGRSTSDSGRPAKPSAPGPNRTLKGIP